MKMDRALLDTGPSICISIDVERDFRLDGTLTTRGIEDGLPVFLDNLRTRDIPYDLFISAEIVDALPSGLDARTVAIGCHGKRHDRGKSSYLNKMGLENQRSEIEDATNRVREAVGRTPIHFRAPNFSADSRTLAILEANGYAVDSSVLPGRHVKRLRLFPLVDHRGAPASPYHPDREEITRQGTSGLLEVPLTPNVLLPGGPLGLGFLNASGPGDAIRAVMAAPSKYALLLAHTWEMVDWRYSDSVAPWVRKAGSSKREPIVRFLDYFAEHSFLNMDQILARESDSRGGREIAWRSKTSE